MPLSGHPIRILLVDPHSLVRAGLRMMLESWEEVRVVGDTANETEGLTLAEREKPGVILLEVDFRSGTGRGLDLVPKLLSVSKARIIVVTHLRDVELHHSAIQYGARGLVLKEHSPQQLRSAILKVNAGEVYLDDRLTTIIITKISQSKRHSATARKGSTELTRLSARESELAQLAGDGLSSKEIGRRLFISETTVRHHLTSIFKKLGVSNRLELIIYLLRREKIGKHPMPTVSHRSSSPAYDHILNSDTGKEVSHKSVGKRRTH